MVHVPDPEELKDPTYWLTHSKEFAGGKKSMQQETPAHRANSAWESSLFGRSELVYNHVEYERLIWRHRQSLSGGRGCFAFGMTGDVPLEELIATMMAAHARVWIPFVKGEWPPT